ncbi:cell division cycle- protein [Actinomortierella ambigua]|nr:cell division cycle- protein [Actinomortierella ambigua]
MDPISTSIKSLDSKAATSTLIASEARLSSLPSLQPQPSPSALTAQDASLQDTAAELGARKRPQAQAQSVPKRPRSTIFDPSSTTVSHWSKRPRKPVVLKPAPVTAVSRPQDAHPTKSDVVATQLANPSHSDNALCQDSKSSKEQLGPVEERPVVAERASSETSMTTIKASRSLDIEKPSRTVLHRTSSGRLGRVFSEKLAPKMTSAASFTPPSTDTSVAAEAPASLSRSSSVAASLSPFTMGPSTPSSLAPSPFVTPSLASFLSSSKPNMTLPRKPSSSTLKSSSSSSSSTFSRSSSLLSSTISSASGPSRTSSTSSLSSICSSTSSSVPNSRSSSSSSLRRGRTSSTITTRHTLARSSSLLRQSTLVDSVSAKLQSLDNRLGWTEQDSLPPDATEAAELEEDYSFLVTPNVMAVSDELLSLSCPSLTADDLEALVSQESTCDECSSFSSSIPLPCPDYVLQPLEDRALEWYHNHPVQDSPLSKVTRNPAKKKSTTTTAASSEQDENILPFRSVMMERAKTTQATTTEATASLTPIRRPSGFRRHKTMQGIKNEYKVTSVSTVARDQQGHEVPAESAIADPQLATTSIGLLPPSAHVAEENQILPFTDPPSGSNCFTKRISGTTLVQVLEGHYKHQYEELMLIDCRFGYEYKGGHIRGAINIHNKKELERALFGSSPLINKKVLVILHCEFSCERGPGMARHLRSMDRTANSINYPALFYPELYVLNGGYSQFFKDYPDYCVPRGYIPMLDAAYSHEYERARKAHLSVFGRTASKGFLGMEASGSKSVKPLLPSRSSGQAINILHERRRSSTDENKGIGVQGNSGHNNNNSSSGSSNSKPVTSRGLRNRAKTIPDLRTVAKLNLDQLRRHVRAAE